MTFSERNTAVFNYIRIHNYKTTTQVRTALKMDGTAVSESLRYLVRRGLLAKDSKNRFHLLTGKECLLANIYAPPVLEEGSIKSRKITFKPDWKPNAEIRKKPVSVASSMSAV